MDAVLRRSEAGLGDAGCSQPMGAREILRCGCCTEHYAGVVALRPGQDFHPRDGATQSRLNGHSGVKWDISGKIGANNCWGAADGVAECVSFLGNQRCFYSWRYGTLM